VHVHLIIQYRKGSLRELQKTLCVYMQIKEGNEAAHKAKRGVRQAVVRCAEVVACTLSSAGGDLLSLVKGVGSDPSMLFNAIMIDEVCPTETLLRP